MVDSPTGQGLAVTDIDAMTPLGIIDVSSGLDRVLSTPGNVAGPLLGRVRD
jgi:hypothetical protein